MIAAVSLMRKRDDVTVAQFRHHWLAVHGPLVCRFAGLRHYVQDHVVASPAMNALARKMRIDGFPILSFDTDADRRRAHRSPEMTLCNDDSRAFVGAVSRVICETTVVVASASDTNAAKVITLLEGAAADDAALACYTARARQLPRLRGLVSYRVLEQGAAPDSTIPHLPVSAAGLAELVFANRADLEGALGATDIAGQAAAHFVVEEYRLA